MKKRLVSIYYDVASPYSFLGVELLRRAEEACAWPITIAYRPFFLGGIMQGTGNRPPGLILPKAQYMNKDLALLSKFYQIEINALGDPSLIFSTLPAMRFLTSVDYELGPSKVAAVSRMFWKRLWQRGLEISSAEAIESVAMDAGLGKDDIKACVQRAVSNEVKTLLRDRTNEALSVGSFGAPTILVHRTSEEDIHTSTMFFGSDRMHLIANELGLSSFAVVYLRFPDGINHRWSVVDAEALKRENARKGMWMESTTAEDTHSHTHPLAKL